MSSRVFNILFFIAATGAVLWDFRPLNIRILDFIFIGFGALFCLYFLFHRSDFKVKKYSFALVMVIIFYAIIGYIQYEHKSSLAIIVLSLIFLALKSQNNFKFDNKYFIYILIFILFGFYLQLVTYHVGNFILDYHQLYGAASRNDHSSIFRASGFFQEPHNHAMAVCLLIMLTLGFPKYKTIHYLGILSLFLSYSTWAAVGGIVMLAISIIWTTETLILTFKRFFLSGFIIISVFSLYDYTMEPKANGLLFHFNRIINLNNDASSVERFSTHKPFTAAVPKSISETNSEQIKFNLFGNGLSTYPFYSGLALNGYSFLWHSLGVFSLFIISLLCWIYFRCSQLSHLEKISFIGGVVFLATSYPLISYAFFWIWLSAAPLSNPKSTHST